MLKPLFLSGIVIFSLATLTSANNLSGLYRPSGELGQSWSCKPLELGMEGGALGIVNNQMHGIENLCDLTQEKSLGPRKTQYTAICSAEGEEYTETVVFEKTNAGINVTREGYTVSWDTCEKDTPSGNSWIATYRMGWLEAGTSDANGNAIYFACQEGQNGGASLNFNGTPTSPSDVAFWVDNKLFTLPISQDGASLSTDCPSCSLQFESLWQAVAKGNRLTIATADGQMMQFGLKGSKDALSYPVCKAASK